MRTASLNAKSGSLPSPPAYFALDNATNRAPGFLASKSCVPGWITTYLNASPTPTVIPWHLWIVVPHANPKGIWTCLHQHIHSVDRLTGTIGTRVGSSLYNGAPYNLGNVQKRDQVTVQDHQWVCNHLCTECPRLCRLLH